MKYVVSFALALGIVACDGPTKIDYSTLRLSIVAGNAQADTVTRTLSDALVVGALDDQGQPQPGVLISFVVVEEGCGSAFAPSLVTNASGRVENSWILGTIAGACTMEARAIDPAGQSVISEAFQAIAMPGRLTEDFLASCGWETFQVDTLDLLSITSAPELGDMHGNDVYWSVQIDAFAHPQSLDPTVPESKVIIGDSIDIAIVNVIYDNQMLHELPLGVSSNGQGGLLLKLTSAKPVC
jgi:hypothetical protein